MAHSNPLAKSLISLLAARHGNNRVEIAHVLYFDLGWPMNMIASAMSAHFHEPITLGKIQLWTSAKEDSK